jgi:predicted signal transduction protein with EAL and GGDEF domain
MANLSRVFAAAAVLLVAAIPAQAEIRYRMPALSPDEVARIGAAYYPDDGEYAEDLLACADLRLNGAEAKTPHG